MTDKVEQTLHDRGTKYGDSWLTPTLALNAICQGDMRKYQPLVDAGLFYNWFMILAKLCRAVYSPEEFDHWLDMSGYSELTQKFLNDKDFRSVIDEVIKGEEGL